MAHVLRDCVLYIGGYDYSGDSNEVTWEMEAETQECTTFASGGWREYKPGLKSATLAAKGFHSAGAGTIDPEAFSKLGVADQVATWGPLGTAGSAAYIGKFGTSGYQFGGAVGEMMQYSLDGKGSNGHGVVRGKLAKAKGAVSGTGGMGSVVELGAVGASQFLYCAVHVFTAGTTISIDVASDEDDVFASGVTRGSVGPITTAGGTWMTRVAGPITDTHWLLNVTACTGTFTIAAVIGIGS